VSARRLVVLAILAALVAAFFWLGGADYLRPDALRARQSGLAARFAEQPFDTAALFFALYVGVCALAVPVAGVLTLAAGAIFGLGWGVLIVSFASSIGATLAFLASRFLLRDWVQARFAARLRPVNEGVGKEGGFYLFALRLVPAFPFFIVNLLMGLTPIRTWTFYWVSQLGMLAGTVAYVYAGTQIGAFRISWGLLAAFALLGVLPLALKRTLEFAKGRRVYARWKRPARFDRNLVVIGAGSAGLVSAYIAAAVKAKVTLVEKDRMGGDCLNTGCVPSKALIKTARVYAQIRNAAKYGLKDAQATVDFRQVMERVQSVVREIEPHDSVARYEGLGVECLRGEARITSPWTVEVQGEGGARTLTTRAIVIAAGARPFVPPIPGLERIEVLTSENLWDLRELPRRLAVLGGGPIGCELAQAFARLGAQVTQVEMLPRLLVREDEDVSALVQRRFAAEGVQVLTGHRAKKVEVLHDGRKILLCEQGERAVQVEFDALLCAVGRTPNVAGYGLEELGIGLTKARTVETNEYLQTLYPNIYACGDVAGPYQFTHTAAHQAWYAAVNALFGFARKFRADYSVIPWATFTDPEVARVGLNDSEAKERGVAYELTTYGLDDLDRAIAESEAHGFVKVLTVPGADRILGATIVGEHAGELITEFVSAMRHGIGLNKILGTIHIYPTFSEAHKYAAGAWKKAHAPQGVLRALARLHAWRRG